MSEPSITEHTTQLKNLCLKKWSFEQSTPKIQCISEFPLVRPDGRGVDVAMLWAYLKKGLEQIREPNGMLSGLRGDNFKLTAGIGRSIVQIHTSEHQTLDNLWTQQSDLIEQILQTAKPKNLTLLTYGRQPTATPSQDQLTQKFASFSVLQTLDKAWTPFSTVAHERVRLKLPIEWRVPTLNLLQWLWPVFVALFGNDHVMGGEDHYQNHLFLRQIMRSKSDTFPIALPPRMRTLDDWIDHTIRLTLLTERDEENWQIAHNASFAEWMNQTEPDEDRVWQHWNDHLPYTFPSAQMIENGVLELRYVSQQQESFRQALSCLCLGISYAHSEIWSFIYAFSPDDTVLDIRGLRTHQIFEQAMTHERDPRPSLNRYLEDAIRFGLDARPAFTGLIEGVLQHASDALSIHHPAMETKLQVLWDKLEQGKSTAKQLRSDFAQQGMPVLLEPFLL